MGFFTAPKTYNRLLLFIEVPATICLKFCLLGTLGAVSGDNLAPTSARTLNCQPPLT